MMKVIEFAIKNKFSDIDQNIVKKMYKEVNKTEKEWLVELRNKFDFDQKPYLRNTSKKEEIVNQIKEKKAKTSSKTKSK